MQLGLVGEKTKISAVRARKDAAEGLARIGLEAGSGWGSYTGNPGRDWEYSIPGGSS